MNEQILYNRPQFPAQLNMAHPLSRGLVGCWVLNDSGGLRAWDSAPYQNRGLVKGASGRFLGRTFVAANSNWISLGVAPQLDLSISTGFTGMAWFRGVGTGTQFFFSSLNGGASVGWTFGLGPGSGNLSYYDLNTGWVNSGLAINSGSWQMVAVSVNTAGTISFYLNGILGATASGANPPSSAGVTKAIGSLGGASDFVNGDISELLILKRALSAQEIRQIYVNPYQMFLK